MQLLTIQRNSIAYQILDSTKPKIEIDAKQRAEKNFTTSILLFEIPSNVSYKFHTRSPQFPRTNIDKQRGSRVNILLDRLSPQRLFVKKSARTFEIACNWCTKQHGWKEKETRSEKIRWPSSVEIVIKGYKASMQNSTWIAAEDEIISIRQ